MQDNHEDWGPFSRPLFDDPSARALSRVGVVDVGSNSVRMVVFDGAARSPAYFFNEKVMAGLGADEVARRERLLAGLFSEELSPLRTASGSMARTSLSGLGARLSGAVGADVSAEDVAPLLAKVAAVGTAFEAMLAEGLDDAPLAGALEVARGRLNACTQGLQRLLDGVLKLDGSPLSVEEFVRRRRRRGGSVEEPVAGGEADAPGAGGETGGGATDA